MPWNHWSPKTPRGQKWFSSNELFILHLPRVLCFFTGATAQQLTNVQVQQCIRFTWLLGMEGNRKMQPGVLG